MSVALLAFVLRSTAVRAHSASDAYLDLTVDAANRAGAFVVHGQWDVALRDLDFVLKLDDDGDGRLTWAEVRHHRAAIEEYAYTYLRVSGRAGEACAIRRARVLIDNHADGAYAALLFDAVCPRRPTKLTVRYNLFFSIDPSHRGIFSMHDGPNTATAVFSPQNPKIDVAL